MGAKKLFCGGLVASQLIGFCGAGSCRAMESRENLVYVGDNNARYGAGGCSFEQSGSSRPQVIFVKEKKKKKVEKSGSSFITPKRLFIAAVVGGAGYWGYKKWNQMTSEQQANTLQWIEYAFDKLYRGAYVVNSARGVV